MRRRSQYTWLFASLLGLVLAGCQTKSEAPQPTTTTGGGQPSGARVGAQAPDFTFTTATGDTITLSSLKGKPVVLNFWASWCHYCAQEAPDLEAFYRQYQPQQLQVLGVGTDDVDAIASKAKELGLTYPVGANPEAAREYGVGGVPHTFIIDREGKIVASVVGYQPKDKLEAEVKKAL